MKRRERREISSEMPPPPPHVYCPSAFLGLWDRDQISSPWAFAKAARLSPRPPSSFSSSSSSQGEQWTGGGVAWEDRCSPFSRPIRGSNLRPRRRLKAVVTRHQPLVRKDGTFQPKLGGFIRATCPRYTVDLQREYSRFQVMVHDCQKRQM